MLGVICSGDYVKYWTDFLFVNALIYGLKVQATGGKSSRIEYRVTAVGHTARRAAAILAVRTGGLAITQTVSLYRQ